MSEQQRFKSPPYPYLDLEAAVEKAGRLADLAKGFSIPISTVAKSWGYSPTSSSTIKVLGALNQFGLIDDEGLGEGKKYKLSELGDSIIRDKRPNSKERSEALRRAALTPKVFLELWERFKSADVDVDTILHELTLGRKQSGRSEYSAAAAEEIASRYRASLGFAGLTGPNESNGSASGDDIPEDESLRREQPKVGDTIQWTSGGIDQFSKPARIVVVSKDGNWVWTDQGSAAAPVAEVVILTPAAKAPSGEVPPPPPPNLAELIAGSNRRVPSDQFEEKKALDEGEAILIWPKELSKDSVEDMEYWLSGVLKQIKRRASKDG